MLKMHTPEGRSSDLALKTCISSASYWVPSLIEPNSAWVCHAPFVFWLLQALCPKTLVLLGVDDGSSYTAFCEAIKKLNVECRCYGIDRSDDKDAEQHESIKRLSHHHDIEYPHFSKLVRADFRDVVNSYNAMSVDLLHVDDDCPYEEVKATFLSWRPKISGSGVILFHGIGERGRGVASLWEELSRNQRHFAFWHGEGLGILPIGKNLPDPVEQLLAYGSDADATRQVRLAYSRLGFSISSIADREAYAHAKATIKKLQQEVRTQNYLAALAGQLQRENEALRSQLSVSRKSMPNQGAPSNKKFEKFVASLRGYHPLIALKKLASKL
jgi:Methyltransferase domain